MIAAAFLMLQATASLAVPANDPTTWINPDDYPTAAIRAGEEGMVRTELSVDRSGNVSGCTIVISSGFAALDEATCRTLSARARFTPARNTKGEPIPTKVQRPVLWQLPKVDPEQIVNSEKIIRVTLKNGFVNSCISSTDGRISSAKDTQNECLTLGSELFLRAAIGSVFSTAKAISLKFSRTLGDRAPDLPPGSQHIVIAEAIYIFGADKKIDRCISRKSIEIEGERLDFCAMTSDEDTPLVGNIGDQFIIVLTAIVER